MTQLIDTVFGSTFIVPAIALFKFPSNVASAASYAKSEVFPTPTVSSILLLTTLFKICLPSLDFASATYVVTAPGVIVAVTGGGSAATAF